MEAPYADHLQIARLVPEGGEMPLPRVRLAHYPIRDTAVTAALLTLGIPRREPGFFTRDVQLDQAGNETGRLRTLFWVGAESPSGEGHEPYKTETILLAWDQRALFAQKYPLHPLNAMRAAHDARQYWIEVIHGRLPLPAQVPAGLPFYEVGKLNGASVLKACGWEPIAFSGRAFYFAPYRQGVHAEQLLATAALPAGRTDPQWMSAFLFNFNELLKLAKSGHTIVQQSFGEGDARTTLQLTADATPKTQEKFFRALDRSA